MKNKKGLEFKIIISLILILFVVLFFLWKFVFTSTSEAQNFQTCDAKGTCRPSCIGEEIANPAFKCEEEGKICCVDYGGTI
jgi:hypothetical protein